MIDIEAMAADVVDCAIKVHKALGPGLLGSAYQYCHSFELKKRGWVVETEVKLPLIYEDQKIDVGYKIDTFINWLVIIENKSVESLLPVHEAQLLTYMKLTGCKLGFLLNWNVPLMKHGIKRFVLNLSGNTPYPKNPPFFNLERPLRSSRLRGKTRRYSCNLTSSVCLSILVPIAAGWTWARARSAMHIFTKD